MELNPEEIVSNWHAVKIDAHDSESSQIKISEASTPYDKALQLIEQAAVEEAAELHLSGMELTELPAEIGQLFNLTELDLRNNSLSSLSAEIGQLSNLTGLDLRNNSLSSLPAEIGQLSNLTELDLRSNSLSSLSAEIGQLTNLKVLYLWNNSLPIPPEVIAKYNEPDTIINYYFSLQSNLQKPLHEAKMLLVGQGNVGKTCVRERLIRNQYNPSRNKTDGIDIEPWDIEINQSKYQINVWDFGGKKLCTPLTNFFSLSAVYICL
ncbi:MAG: leucine-rich repeat domain-containing protein [Cyanobacteria bacterium P01_G01_bin.67]